MIPVRWSMRDHHPLVNFVEWSRGSLRPIKSIFPLPSYMNGISIATSAIHVSIRQNHLSRTSHEQGLLLSRIKYKGTFHNYQLAHVSLGNNILPQLAKNGRISKRLLNAFIIRRNPSKEGRKEGHSESVIDSPKFCLSLQRDGTITGRFRNSFFVNWACPRAPQIPLVNSVVESPMTLLKP